MGYSGEKDQTLKANNSTETTNTKDKLLRGRRSWRWRWRRRRGGEVVVVVVVVVMCGGGGGGGLQWVGHNSYH